MTGKDLTPKEGILNCERRSVQLSADLSHEEIQAMCDLMDKSMDQMLAEIKVLYSGVQDT